MSNFLNKIKFFRRRAHSARPIELINPPREWMIGLLLASCTFVLGTLYLGYDFWEQYHMVDNQPVADESVVRYHQSDAEYYRDAFRKRDAEFNALRAEVRAPIVVPSTLLTEEDEAGSDEGVPENSTKPIAP